MKVLLLAAMDKELNLMINILENPVETKLGDKIIWEGKVKNHRIFATKCGIGKVNSAVNTQILINNLHPDLVINSGVAGGAGLSIGSILVADKVAYHDVWCGPGTLYGQADGLPLFMTPDQYVLSLTKDSLCAIGLICSGDKFISSAEEIAFIRSKFPEVKAVDMESASIAQTCILNDTPFAIIRVVSDTPGEGENISQYEDFWSTAPEKTFSIVKKILATL